MNRDIGVVEATSGCQSESRGSIPLCPAKYRAIKKHATIV